MSQSLNPTGAERTLAMRPEDALADNKDWAEIGGVSVRKGTVAAFLQNAMRWTDPATVPADRDDLSREIVEAVPALRALGVLTVFEARDEGLRSLLGSC